MSDEDDSKTIPGVFLFFSSVLALVLLLSKALHSRPKLNALLSEPAMVLLVGIFCSLVLPVFFEAAEDVEGDDDYADNTFENIVFSFPSNIFFMVLLPPILFNSGYQLERELFYRHIKPITLFAVMGTAISGFATGFALYGAKLLGWFGDFDPSLLELLTFGALIAATDTVSILGVLQTKRVDPHLFSLVFGESALNDAVAIVLFRTLSSMLENGVEVVDASSILAEVKSFAIQFSIEAFGSPALGIFFSFLMALLFKHADLRENKVFELSLYILVTLYIPYQIAELAHLSGIVTIFFVGMSARRYIEPNVSDETKASAEAVFKVTAYIAETCIFLELGLCVFQIFKNLRWGFAALAFFASLFGRAASIYPLSAAFNFSLQSTVDDPLLEITDDLSIGSESSCSTASSNSPGKMKWRRRRRRKTPEKWKDKKIPTSFMHVLWFAGLRGAVAYACAREFPNRFGHTQEFTAATMAIVLVTIIVMGGGTEPLLEHLQIPMNVDQKEYMKLWRTQRRLKGFFHYFENEYIYKVAVREKRKKRPTSAADSYEYDPNEGVAGKMTVELIPIEKSPSIPELKGHFS